MRHFTLALDSLPAVREATHSVDCSLGAAAELAQLAGVDALRLAVGEDLQPVREGDVRLLRRVARELELRMAASQSLLKLALEVHPDRVVLVAPSREGPAAGGPIDLRLRQEEASKQLRALEETGVEVACRIAPVLEAVKAAHGLGAAGVELFTGATLDLPASERRPLLERLGDAARLAKKLGLQVGIGGGLAYHSVSEVLRGAPECRYVAVGRAVWVRAVLVGIDRAVRDFRALLS